MASPPKLSHLDEIGQARMVDVRDKPVSKRGAAATGTLRMKPESLQLLLEGKAAKGDVLAVARVAAIQAAKRTPDLIPLCHRIALTSCEVTFSPGAETGVLHIESRVRAVDRTGAEMEALTAVCVAALTIYDMLKAVDRTMIIEAVMLIHKSGGKSGEFNRFASP
jgi:cyclic pyranopterin phosphate synthase